MSYNNESNDKSRLEKLQEEYDRKYKPELSDWEKQRLRKIQDRQRLERAIEEEKRKNDPPFDEKDLNLPWYG